MIDDTVRDLWCIQQRLVGFVVEHGSRRPWTVELHDSIVARFYWFCRDDYMWQGKLCLSDHLGLLLIFEDNHALTISYTPLTKLGEKILERARSYEQRATA